MLPARARLVCEPAGSPEIGRSLVVERSPPGGTWKPKVAS